MRPLVYEKLPREHNKTRALELLRRSRSMFGAAKHSIEQMHTHCGDAVERAECYRLLGEMQRHNEEMLRLQRSIVDNLWPKGNT